MPWADRAKFAGLMLCWDMRSYRHAAASKAPVVFDRGIPDSIGYLEECRLPIPAHFEAAARDRRYRREVFIAPPWPEIFVNDAERGQSLLEAEATFRAMVAVYSRLGYRLIEVPRVPVEERVEFLTGQIGTP